MVFQSELQLVKELSLSTKQYQYFNTEDVNYSEDKAAKYKTIDLGQLLAQAQANNSISSDEAADFSKVDEQKKVQVLAQATVESVTALQLDARRKKKDTQASEQEEEEKKEKAAEGDEDAEVVAPPTPMPKTEMIVMLLDFPKTQTDVEALQKFGFNKLNATFVIEEIFSRE